MVTSISLGNVFNVNGKNVFGGGQSGLDIEGLVEDLVSAKSISITQIETKIETNTEKVTAFSELDTLMTNLKSAADFLRNPPGVNNADNNIFAFRSVDTQSNNGTAASTYIDVTASPGAQVQNVDIQIATVAKAKIQTSDVIAGVVDATTDSVVSAAGGANRFTAGTLEINNGVTVDLADGDTLYDILSKVNAVKDTSGVEASLVKTGADSYVLQFKATETGLDADFDMGIAANTAPGGVLENIGLASQAADNATFTLDGIAITSQSNVITDAINGVNFTIKQATGGATLTSSIQEDSELVVQGINNFVNAVNDIKVFNAQMNERGADGQPLETATLSSNRTLQTVMSQLNTQINRIVDGLTGGDPQSLADIGITFIDFEGDAETPAVKNVLSVDVADLTTALAADFEAVRKVFEFDLQSDSPLLSVFERSNASSINSFQLDIDSVGKTATATFDIGAGPQVINLDYSELSGSITINGQEGTELEGLVLIYGAVQDDSIQVDFSQGVADSVYNMLENLQDETNGAVAVEVSSLTTNNNRYEDDIIRVEEQIARFREQLLRQFSALEQAIASVNTLLQSLDAQATARANA